jgi:5-formyltetrahydrofolate cyclo-ligase
MIPFSKKMFRLNQKEKLSSLEKKFDLDQIINKHLENILPLNSKILAYLPDKYEVDIKPLIEKRTDLKVYFPRIIDDFLKTLCFETSESFVIGKYGILEPKNGTAIEPKNADFIIVPSLGFNKNGFRLGRGGGYYDRFLKNLNPNKFIGLTYEKTYPCDFIEEDHDIKVDKIITEHRIILVMNDFFNPDK